MRALLLSIALVPALAHAEVPHDADELTYRVDLYWDRKGPPEHTERTERASEVMLNSEYRDVLLRMQPGEHRWIYGTMVNGMECDHFGCAPAHKFSEKIELVAVTPHHDLLPGGVRIAAHPLRVVDGKTSALLPADPVSTILEVRLSGDRVAIEVTYEPGARRGTLTFGLDELSARIADVRATAALARGDRRVATKLLDDAIVLDPMLDQARVHRAQLLRLDADAELAIVAARNPVWLEWQLRADRELRKLVGFPAVRALEQPGGVVNEIAMDESALTVLAEPTGRYLAVHATPAYGGDTMRIIDRQSATIVASISVWCTDWRNMSSAGAPERCSAASVGGRALAHLGFAPTRTEAVRDDTVRVGDVEITRWKSRDLERASDVTVARSVLVSRRS